MITGLQLAIASGGLIGLGLTLLIARLLPVEPDLADALDRVAATRHRSAINVPAAHTGKERLGLWGLRVLPSGLWARTPTRQLALLRISTVHFYGEKLTFAGLGLVIPPGLTTLFNIVGLSVPLQIPALASPVMAIVMFFIPNYNALDDAKKARLEFARALGAYIDMVALERNNGVGVRQAMETAAEVGDSLGLHSTLRRTHQIALVRPAALGRPAHLGNGARTPRARRLRRHHAPFGRGRSRRIRHPARPLRRHAHGDAQRRDRPSQRRRRTHDHPRLLARRHLHGSARRPLTASHVHGLVTRKDTHPGGTQMLKALVLLQIAVLHLSDDLRDRLRAASRSERGSVTTEHVLWAVAVIAIVGIVVAAITSYVTKQSGNIK
jgi:hypothetical protein